MSKLNTPETLATITMLAIRWPLAFWVLETRRRPLKVGIHLDVMAAGGFEEAALRDALRAYTINAAYRRNLIAKAERVALDGSVAGWVTPEQAAIARDQNDAFFRRARQRQERKRPAAPQVAPKIRPLAGSQVASPAIGANEASGTSGRSTGVERLGALEVL